MSENHVMMHREKIKARRSVRELMKEYFRDEENAHKYENGVRNIDIEKTRNNYALVEPPSPKELDRLRRERFDLIDKRRRENGQRGLRKDTVDSLMTIVQTGGVFIENMTRDEQIKFFEDVVDVMREDPDTYGKIDAAVIHFDETTPHMQVLTSTLDFENNRSNAKRMMGNQIKMSVDQTNFVKSVQAKGYEVERGKNTFADNYQEWKKEAEQKYKIKINRHNEHLINELEERETQIDMAETQTKEEVIEDLKTFYPSVKFKYNSKTNKGKVVGTNSENYHSEDLHHFNEDESVNTLKQLNIERLLKLKEVAREKQLRTEKEEQERKEKEIEERETELNERDELLNNREDDLNERESAFDDKVDEFNNMHKRSTHYAYCEYIKNKATRNWTSEYAKNHYDDFKAKTTYSWEKESGMKNRVKKQLLKENETIVNQPEVEKEEKGFELEN